MASYRDSDVDAPHQPPRVVVRIQPKPLATPILAIVDTAAPWCILKPQIGNLIADDLDELPGRVRLSTRMGLIEGRLFKGWLTLLAQEGESLDLEATFFLSAQWQGSNFLGYEGALERVRFAVDPRENQFYFGETG
ncbi:MAG TPA: hypothetical protein VH988_10560 [Thermoanaerobaculia bacterium]|jgi:hypothetical protein|nr:hypothetical protein [Thermoanaerobaculia bacterium]